MSHLKEKELSTSLHHFFHLSFNQQTISNHSAMTPKQVVQQFVKHFNDADASALAELYHENAINHQVPDEPVKGKQAIQKMFEKEFSDAEMHCIVENLFEDGDWAILEWKDPQGLRGCGFFHVTEGKIKFQRGYWDKLSFLKMHGLPLPTDT